jgi:hypothetical protein
LIEHPDAGGGSSGVPRRPLAAGDQAAPAARKELDAEQVKKWLEKYPTNELPHLLTELYGVTEVDCGRTIASMKRNTTCFRHWCVFCEWSGRSPAYVNPAGLSPNEKLGLRLYYLDAFTTTTSDDQAFDKKTVGDFLDFLHKYCDGVSYMDRCKNWMNGNLNVEHLIRMRAANHRDPVRGNASVGKNQTVKSGAQKHATTEKSEKAYNNFEDIHESMDPNLNALECRSKFAARLVSELDMF